MAVHLKDYIYNELTGKIEPVKRSKYGNRKTKADGYTFDSQAEYRRYCELKLDQEHGYVTNLRVHPTYLLQEAFTDNQGKKHRAIYYEADFVYLKNGVEIVEDVKGKETKDFRLKMKMFLYKFRQYRFKLTKVV